MFNNNVIKGGTYETRYIASWINAGGKLRIGKALGDFRRWLSSLGLDKSDVDHIVFLAMNGKLELENSAKAFIANNK